LKLDQTLKNNKNNRIRGVIGTLIFHAVVLAMLFLLGFSTALPLPGEEGVEVSLGSSDQGFGDRQPDKPSIIKQTTPPPTAQEKVEDQIVTQDTEDAPAVEESTEDIPNEKTVDEVLEKEIDKEEPDVNPLALYKGKSKQTTEITNEGIAGGEGDQGSPGGDKDVKTYLGKGGFGDGPNWSLAGRTPKYLPKPSSTFLENGTVAVQITVNKYGKVLKAIAIDKGSNTTDSRLRKLAEEAALKAVFNARTDAAEMQRGIITYHFIVKN